MAQRGLLSGLSIVLLVAVFFGHGSAQSSCPAVILSLAPCLSYVTGNSSTPTTSCCSQLASVVQNQPQCLCTLLNGGAALTVNQTQALALPGACQVQTPPLSQCNAAVPATSPTEAPAAPSTPSVPSNPSSSTPSNAAAPSESTPSVPNTPSGNGSKTTPTTTGQSSAGSSTMLSLSIFLSHLFIASYASSASFSF